MVLEELILRYYLKIYSLIILFLVLFYLFYVLLIKDIAFKNNYFLIEKNQNYNQIINKNLLDYNINLSIYKFALRLILFTDIKIHYGKFEILENENFLNLILKIIKKSNFYEKITIVEGSGKKDLNIILKNNFNNFEEFNYDEIIADTYFFAYGSSFNDFKKELKNKFDNLKIAYESNLLLERFSFSEIIIIGSLLEKEGLDYHDKKKIFSVIMNRLNKKMKLQIDATVIFAITNGDYKLDRKLTYNDLKIDNIYNTYVINGLPPEPISYVGLKTIELIFENYNTDYLFYFYNSIENKHIYSIDYKNHLNKLNEYRSKK